MAKSNIKRRIGGGRALGSMPVVAIRLPAAILMSLDALAKDEKKTRTEIMREIMEKALGKSPRRGSSPHSGIF